MVMLRGYLESSSQSRSLMESLKDRDFEDFLKIYVIVLTINLFLEVRFYKLLKRKDQKLPEEKRVFKGLCLYGFFASWCLIPLVLNIYFLTTRSIIKSRVKALKKLESTELPINIVGHAEETDTKAADGSSTVGTEV